MNPNTKADWDKERKWKNGSYLESFHLIDEAFGSDEARSSSLNLHKTKLRKKTITLKVITPTNIELVRSVFFFPSLGMKQIT